LGGAGAEAVEVLAEAEPGVVLERVEREAGRDWEVLARLISKAEERTESF
jgi:hypothetical protein